MSIDLEKQVKKASIVLEKRGIAKIPCQVKLAIDKSGSMDSLYRANVVQKVVERVLAISMNVDMDGTVDIWAFHNDSLPAKAVTADKIDGYVNREIMNKFNWGGTSYAPVMEDILQESCGSNMQKAKSFLGGLFGKPSTTAVNVAGADPILAILITDGENDDKSSTEDVIKNSQGQNIYWQLIGIGGSRFPFLDSMGEKYPNCGFVGIGNIDRIDDEDLYSAIINEEFASWIKKFA
jgi:hypothetical protein